MKFSRCFQARGYLAQSNKSIYVIKHNVARFCLLMGGPTNNSRGNHVERQCVQMLRDHARCSYLSTNLF